MGKFIYTIVETATHLCASTVGLHMPETLNSSTEFETNHEMYVKLYRMAFRLFDLYIYGVLVSKRWEIFDVAYVTMSFINIYEFSNKFIAIELGCSENHSQN